MVQTLQPTALVLIVVFPALSTITVAARVWIRIVTRQFNWGKRNHGIVDKNDV